MGRLWLAPLGVVAVAALLLVGRSDGASDPSPLVAPAFSVEDVRNPAATVALPAGRPSVVNFFATWCAPCREELPILQRASARHGSQVAFVGIDVADSRTKATDLLDELGIGFPAGYDPHRKVADAYRLTGMPTTVFVAADGRVAGTVRGPLTAKKLDEWVERLREAA
ncbi:MAG TPA: TlpA disulfide reductase family protein [Acidimicrobiales bacterium]|nr:TlpA disulfide reductase family protein [Acidimicrobiales bacterium]